MQNDRALTTVQDAAPQIDSKWLETNYQAQRALALAKPRDEKAILDAAIGELDIVPEFAARSYYSVPRNQKQDDGSFKKIYIEGPSIRAARSLARRWGNQMNGFRVASQDEERIVVEGVFFDFETNSCTLRQVTVPRCYVARDTKARIPLREDMLNQAILSGGSKAVRNAIIHGLPDYLVERIFQRAKEIAGKLSVKGTGKTQNTAERIKASIAAFTAIGADERQVKAYIEKLETDWSDEDKLGHLAGLYTAIKDGHTKLDEIFGQQDKPTAPVEGELTLGDVMGGEASESDAQPAERKIRGRGKSDA